MSRISKLMELIEQGVKDGIITEEKKKEYLGTRISSKFDLDRLEEAVNQDLQIE